MKQVKSVFVAFVITLLSIQAGQSQNVGIGTSTPTRAKLEVDGLVGNTAAIFGGGNGETGISVVANIPGLYFNSYYNNGMKSLSAGPTGILTLNNSNQFQFDFAAVASSANQSLTNSTKLLIGSDGKMAVNMPAVSTRAMFEQQGAISVNSAIFGGDGKGVSLQKDWPAIGLNHYFNGNHLSIGGGYGAQIGVDQNTGALYFAQFSNSAPLANGLLLNPIAAINFKYGKIGVNTNDPQAPVDIYTPFDPSDNSYANAPFAGLRLSGSLGYPLYWNLWPRNSLIFSANGQVKAAISSTDGAYFNYSDRSLKKNIEPISNDGIEKLNRLKPSTYLFLDEIDGNAKRHLGFVAQDLEEVVPEVVMDSPDGKKMVNYTGLIPILTKAMQEQQKIIEKQQQQIDWLMKKVQ